MVDISKIDISRFFAKENLDYFLAPKQTGYDITKTLLYALILVVAIYFIYKILYEKNKDKLKKFKIKIDQRLAIAVAPYVVFGGAIRVLQDAGVVNSYFFMTPGIHILVFGIIFSALLASFVFQKKFSIPYYKTMFLFGILLLPFTLLQLNFSNFYGAVLVLLFFIPWVIIFKSPILSKLSKWSKENKIVTLIHIFDATTTAVALYFFGYYEQHVLPTAFINILGPFSFIPLKAVAIIIVLILIDRLSDDKEFNNYLKLVIGILGAATGSRDFISLLAMV